MTAMDLAVYAVDVGSIPQKRLGWARADVPGGGVDPEAQETDISGWSTRPPLTSPPVGLWPLDLNARSTFLSPRNRNFSERPEVERGTALGRPAPARARWRPDSCRRPGRYVP